jgi:FlaA1/EpsC-like NDP-sugar epimerase
MVELNTNLKQPKLKTDFLLNDKVIVVIGATGILGEAFVNGIAEAEHQLAS